MPCITEEVTNVHLLYNVISTEVLCIPVRATDQLTVRSSRGSEIIRFNQEMAEKGFNILRLKVNKKCPFNISAADVLFFTQIFHSELAFNSYIE